MKLAENWSDKTGAWRMRKQDADLTFAIQTDTHVDLDNSSGKNNCAPDIGHNVRMFAEAADLDFYANLGDFIEGYPEDTTEDMRADLIELFHRYCEDAPCPVVLALGNHDSNSMYVDAHGGEYISNEELYTLIRQNVQKTCPRAVFPGNVCYYYIDFAKVRVVVLNTQDTGRPTGFAIGDAQLAWLKETALRTDRAVLLMGHAPLVRQIGSNLPKQSEEALAILKAFRDAGGQVIGCFYGHEHTQSAIQIDGIWHIAFSYPGCKAEAVAINLRNRTIQTQMIGHLWGEKDREFLF